MMEHAQDLRGRIALITGGGKGVGKVVAHQLARRGAHVLINCFHSYEQAKQTRAELQALGAQADVFRASVARRDQVDRMFEEIEERFGFLDILVNNAAAGWLGPVAELDELHFTKALSTNLLGSFWCARRAAPLMAVRGRGCIVNISSIGAGMAPRDYLAVGSSKAALEALTRHLAAEFAPMNVRVNTASCSLIDGEVANLFPHADQMKEVTVRNTPLGRLATAEDLAGVVAFLTSEQSGWVTGQVVMADGGLGLGQAMLSAPQPTDVGAHRVADGSQGVAPPLAVSGEQASRSHSAPALTAAAEPTVPDISRAAVVPVADPPAVAGGDDPVVVVGMGLVTPGANSPDEYWDLAIGGAELFVDVPPNRWDGNWFHDNDKAAPDKTYQTKSAFITGFTPDPDLAEEIARGAVSTDETTQWLRHALRQALRGVARRDTDRFTFCVGYTADGNQHLEEALVLSGISERLHGLGTQVPTVTNAIADRLWRGRGGCAQFLPHRVGQAAMKDVLPDGTELLMLDTACSSSLYAIDLGMKSLLLGTHDVAVCGGAFALGPRGAVLFSKLHGLSTSGEVRSLDKNADGVLFSDGAGVVVLKRLSRAVADGDTVLGVLAAIGTSSDGKGKAIYAPAAAGQSIAVDRSIAAPGMGDGHVDWVLAHATGTTAGDHAEMTSLRTSLGPVIPAGRTVQVTSNKSLIGHTGWAAGAVSIIEVLLGLRNNTIPRQHRFTEAPATFELSTGPLRIPTKPVPWPGGADRSRAAAVSGFGFGGTNAHLIVREHDGRGVATPAVSPDEPVVVVGWSARLPGLQARADIEGWLRGDPSVAAPDASFGDTYPAPPLTQVRIPPGTTRSLDRCQLMLLESVLPLRDDLGEFWERSRDNTGVIVGHLGPTRNATLYAHRCYLDEMRAVVSAAATGDASDAAIGDFETYANEIRRLVPESNENSFPGIMPNVIPARVSNYLDLHGVNMTVDTGLASALSALDVAVRYLRAGDLDLALVAGVNGNSTPESSRTAGELLVGGDTAAVAEGAFTVALVRESTARAHGLRPLARIDTMSRAADEKPLTIIGGDPTEPSYLGADGLVAVLKSLIDARGPSTIWTHDRTGPVVRVIPSDDSEQDSQTPVSVDHISPTVRRHRAVTKPFALELARRQRPFVASGTVVLTDNPALLAHIELPPGAAVLSTQAPSSPIAGLVHLPTPTPDSVARAFGDIQQPIKHVRLLAELPPTADTPSELALHDLLFLTIQQCYAGLTEPDASLAVCLLGGWADGAPHPSAGLWTGLVKSTSVEVRSLVAYTVLTTSRDAAEGIAQVTRESGAKHFLPVVVYDQGVRKTSFLEPVDPEIDPNATTPLGPDSIILAAGGSRGIAAEVLLEIARRYRPTIYVLGRSVIATEQAAISSRADYVRSQLQNRPGTSVADLNREYQRLVDAQTTRSNLDQMAEHSGAGRVHYLQCDLSDKHSVQEAAATVLRDAGRVDLLLNVAGINRSADIPSKRFEDFRAVRDVKVHAYRNLAGALGNNVSTWCNFGSIIGFTGQSGETDYAAANDYLVTASQAAAKGGRNELTIGWCLWRDAGLGADPVKKSFLEKSGIYTGMSSAEGVYHFLREILGRRTDPAVVLLGASEAQALEEYRPGYLAAGAGSPSRREAAAHESNCGPIGFMLDRKNSSAGNEADYERSFDLERDSYLAEHVVLGHPTLPGTFVTEIAAEAAVDLVAGRVPVAFENLTLSSFLRVYHRGRPVRKRITAELLHHDELSSRVRVRVLGDIVAPSGHVLVRDREHFQIDVLLQDCMPSAPRWERWSAHEDGQAIPDPYHMEHSPALLTDRLISTKHTRQHALGRRATFDLHVQPDDPAFARFMVPAILFDAMLRVSVLDPVRDDHLIVAAPTSIRRIDLYTTCNDVGLSLAHPTIDLYSCPRRLDLEGPPVSNRCVAASPDGTMLAQIHDTSTAILGYIHIETGRFSTREQMDANIAGALRQ
jgi:NAD(P)-dependent dehydrogenase (short-subunit alcohol dehydrogenase family)/3-oxoacyl-(acyl-carrier-protein) synthase